LNGLPLRQASPSNRKFPYPVKRAAFKEEVEKVWGWDEDEQRQRHEPRCGSQDFRVVNLAGTEAPDGAHVNQLLLLSAGQGKDNGRRCMWRVVGEARRLGLPVRLRVMKVNPRVLAFYQRLEFLRNGKTDTPNLMG
jgi:GNAT superfamily N-acetyltransferase